MTIRIAILIARLNIGGPATHVLALASALPKDRFDVRVFAGQVGPGESDMGYLAKELGVTVERIPELGPKIGLRDLLAFFRLLGIFRAWKPDIVHTHTAKAGALGRVAARLSGVKYVLHTFHGHVLRGYFSPPAEAFFRFVERILAFATDRIITLSPALKKDLVEMGIAPDEKISIVPLGMDLEKLVSSSLRRKSIRKEMGVADSVSLIGIVGRLVPIKNHRLFFEAARSMVDSGFPTEFLIVGDGELMQELQGFCRDLGIAQQVRFLGWRQDMSGVYPAMDILALTSENEGTPVAIIEAMAAGVPVVATAVGGVPDVVRDRQTGLLVPPGDSKALMKAWALLLDDRALAKKMTEEAKKFVMGQFGKTRMISEMIQVYLQQKPEDDAIPVSARE